CENKPFPTRLLYGFNNSLVLPGVDIRAVDGLMVWKDVLNAFEDPTASFFVHCCQDRGDAVRLCRHGKTNGIVDHHRWFVTVDIRELERLVINHHNHAIVRREKRIESDSRKCLHDAVLFSEEI